MKSIQFKNNSNIVQSSASLDKLKTKDGLDINQVISSNISSLVSSQALDDEEISALELTVGNINSNITGIQTTLSSATTTLNALQTQLTTANSNISSLQSSMTTANANISTNANNITNLQSSKANLTANTFSGLQVFANGSNTALQVTNMASSGHVFCSGGDKSFQVNTGNVSLGAPSGSNLTLYNPKFHNYTIIYDNPAMYYDDYTSQITDPKHLVNKSYVDNAVANVATGATLSEVQSHSNVFTEPQSYSSDTITALDNNNLISRGHVTALDSKVVKFFTNGITVGGASAVVSQISPTSYKLYVPVTGTNTITNNITTASNYNVAQVVLNLPDAFANGDLILARQCTIRVRMDVEMWQPLTGILSADYTKNPYEIMLDNRPIPIQSGSFYHSNIESVLNLAISGVGNTLYANCLYGTKLINNSTNTANDWTYNLQPMKYKGGALVFNPFTFSATDSKSITINVNIGNKKNQPGDNYWIGGYAWKIEVLNSLPSSTTAILSNKNGFEQSDMRYATGGASFNN